MELQFYLLWPLLILFMPRRLLKPAVIGAIALAPAYRLFMALSFPADQLAHIATLGCLDSLGAGALLAIVVNPAGAGAVCTAPGRAFTLVSISSLLLYALAHTAQALEWGLAPLVALKQTFLAVVFVRVVWAALIGLRGWPGRVLEAAPLRYLGKISYGLYLYHPLAVWALPGVLAVLNLDQALAQNFPIRLLMLGSLTLAAAAGSWHLLELPVNNLKRRFPYRIRLALPSPPAGSAPGIGFLP